MVNYSSRIRCQIIGAVSHCVVSYAGYYKLRFSTVKSTLEQGSFPLEYLLIFRQFI